MDIWCHPEQFGKTHMGSASQPGDGHARVVYWGPITEAVATSSSKSASDTLPETE